MDPNLQGMKEGHPFLITGLGASGTRWLAKHLNSGLNWKVHHEPGDDYYINDAKVFTGTVDSTVRHTILADEYAEEGRLAVVIRDPRDIAAHCVRKGTWHRVKNEIVRDVTRLNELLERGAFPVSFGNITKRRSSLVVVEKWAGVRDIPYSHTVSRVGHAGRRGPAHSVQVAARNEVWRDPAIRAYIDRWVLGG